MPGNVPAASPADFFPSIAYRAFSESREWAVLDNAYARGEVQVSTRVSTSRKGPWRLTWRGSAADLATLRSFYDDHGMTQPFYFTPVNESQKTARFNSPWQQSSGRGGICEATLEIVEIA